MRTRLIHCSYHKCMTLYYRRVMGGLYNRTLRFSRGYRHFRSLLDDFYRESDRYRIASLNNHALDLGRLGDFRISRFIRDPRDLVVSGYFYHLRGAEPWCHIIGPKEEDWKDVNGHIPKGMGKNHSFSTFLQGLTREEGLIAEIGFRKHHFESMLSWPVGDPRIKTFRYEDLIGNEADVFEKIFSFYELPWAERRLGVMLAKKFSAKKQTGSNRHIRNPQPDQWKDYFTPAVSSYFEERYGKLLERYAYQ